MTQLRHPVNMLGMSDTAQASRTPTFTLGWRMRLALEDAQISVQEIATALHVSRATVSRWLHDTVEPTGQILFLWARACGVDYDWLAGPDGPPEGGLSILDLINRTALNQDDDTVIYIGAAA